MVVVEESTLLARVFALAVVFGTALRAGTSLLRKVAEARIGSKLGGGFPPRNGQLAAKMSGAFENELHREKQVLALSLSI